MNELKIVYVLMGYADVDGNGNLEGACLGTFSCRENAKRSGVRYCALNTITKFDVLKTVLDDGVLPEENTTPKMIDFGFGVPSTSSKKIWEMTPEEVQQCCKEGKIREVGNVGDTFGDGKYTYTIIGINQDIPCDENGILLTDGCKDVLSVMCLGAPVGPGNGKPVLMDASKTPWGTNRAPMNIEDTNEGSWEDSVMRRKIMPNYLSMLPAETQKVIGYVLKITGQCDNEVNIITVDKCFLLSGKEIFGGSEERIGSYYTANEADATLQYQYFETIATTPQSRNVSNDRWWLRSPHYDGSYYFCYVYDGYNGSLHELGASYGGEVFPTMCIY